MSAISATGKFQLPKKTKLVLATPAYGGTFCAEYVNSFYSLMSLCMAKGISILFSHVDYADVVASRNYLLSNFYFNKPDAEILLFVDSDMGWSAELIFAMIALNEPVVGVIAPRRSIDLELLHQNGALPFKRAYARALDFIGRPADTHPRDPNFRSVDNIGAGILLIRRSAIDSMISKIPSVVDTEKFRRFPFPFAERFTKFLTAFDRIALEDRWLSEDISFCHRWTTSCNGKIYAATNYEIVHVARVAISGKWEDLQE